MQFNRPCGILLRIHASRPARSRRRAWRNRSAAGSSFLSPSPPAPSPASGPWGGRRAPHRGRGRRYAGPAPWHPCATRAVLHSESLPRTTDRVMIAAAMAGDDADGSNIAAIRIALEAAENASNADAATALLSDDAVIMVPDFPVQEGRAACAAFLREMMGWLAAGFDRQVSYTSDEVNVTGDLAFDHGTFAFTISPKGPGVISRVTGKYLWILQRSPRGEWAVTRLIASRDEDGEAGTTEESVRERASGRHTTGRRSRHHKRLLRRPARLRRAV